MPVQLPFRDRIAAALTPVERLPLREWAERNIIIPMDYQSPRKGRFSMESDFMFHEPVAMVDVFSVRVIVFVKPPQFGGSQNLMLPAGLRALRLGYPVLYSTDEKLFAEQFRIERLLPLLRASPTFDGIGFHERETEVYLNNGGLIAFIFAGSKSGKKGRAIFLVLADEYDAYPFGVAESLRGRITRYESSGAKIIYLSQLDPHAERKTVKIAGVEKIVTPILLEYEMSSRAQWIMPDPATGKDFTFDFGFPDSNKNLPAWGVKWGHVVDGKNDARRPYGWSEARIAETARIVTPDGAVLTDEDRKQLIARGRWVHEIEDRRLTSPGYRCTCLHDAGRSLAQIVLDFLSAKSKGPEEFRAWVTEQLVELPYMEKQEPTQEALAHLRRDYKRGTPILDAPAFHKALADCPACTLSAIDVQAKHNGLWQIVVDLIDCRGIEEIERERLGLGELTLAVRDWFRANTFEECAEFCDSHGVNAAMIDAKFDLRRAETYSACLEFGFLPAIGHAVSQLSMPWKLREIDPHSLKKTKHGHKALLNELIYRKAPIAIQTLSLLLNASTGLRLIVPDTLDEILTSQLTSVKLLDGVLHESKNNHLFDCLCMTVLLAKFRGSIPA